jgi:hypothetical protein
LKEHGFKITAEKLDSGTKLKIKLKWTQWLTQSC